ncbi:DNA polymerase III subunit gamma/tau [Candidatus Margulisiibacteriota bacterium]
MAHVSLYRKYRPQTFSEIIGQTAVIRILQNAIQNDLLNHAYIFSGPRGTGKTSTARILAKALNCRQGRSVTPCLECDLCLRIKSGEALDVFEIDAASNRGIDEIRDLREKIAFAPVEGKYKIYIIDEAHMLTEPAFNALLKTLEEPPENTIFVLATTEPHKIPVTILSRCQRLDFKMITLPDILKMLKMIAEKEKITVEEKALRLIAQNAEGGMRDAVSLLEQIYSFKGKEIKVDDVLAVLGTTDVSSIFKLAEYLLNGESGQALKYLEELVIAGKNIDQLAKDILNHYRHLILAKAKAFEAINLPEEQLNLINEQTAQYDLEGLKQIISILSRAQREMRWFPNARLILEIALIEVGSFKQGNKKAKVPEKVVANRANLSAKKKPVVSISEPTKKVSPQKQKIEVPEPTKIEAAPSNTEEIQTLAEIKHHWQDILNKVKGKKFTTYILLCESEPIEMKAGKLILRFKKNFSFHKEKFMDKDNLAVFRDILADYTAKPLEFGAQMEEAEESAGENNSDQKKAIDPAVKSLVDMFDGKLVEKH